MSQKQNKHHTPQVPTLLPTTTLPKQQGRAGLELALLLGSQCWENDGGSGCPGEAPGGFQGGPESGIEGVS